MGMVSHSHCSDCGVEHGNKREGDSVRKSTKHFCIIVALVFIIQPFLLQNAYTAEAFDELGTTFLASGQASTSIGYLNTTGSYVSSGVLAESDTADGEVTFGPATMAAQDLDKAADMQTAWTTASTIWNATCFSSVTMDDPVITIGLRIFRVGGDEGVPMEVWGGWQGAAYDEMLITEGHYIYTSEDDLTYFHISAAQREDIEDIQGVLASAIMHFRFREANADELITGASFEVEVHLYTDTGSDTFYTYLLYMGCLNFLIALGMTSAWNPTGGSRRRRRRRR